MISRLRYCCACVRHQHGLVGMKLLGIPKKQPLSMFIIQTYNWAVL